MPHKRYATIDNFGNRVLKYLLNNYWTITIIIKIIQKENV